MRIIPFLSSALLAIPALAQIPNSYPIFDRDAVHEIKITFANADWFQVLTANYDGVRVENPYFPASIEWGENKFENIGVRFKGNSSYSASRGRKKPFRLKLNEFVKGQKIDGIGSFSLSNGWNDPSFVREKAYYEVAAAIGLKAPRSNYAALTINGEYFGLYMLTEVINSDFLKNYYGKGEDDGNLYKGNIGSTFAYLGEDKAAYKNAWEKQTNEEADDWTDLIALCKLINDTAPADFRAKLEPVMDIDSVLTALAVDNATVNLDSYVGMAQNFNIYRRPSDKRWVWIPWDPSLAFGALSQGQTIQGMKELPLEWSNTGGGFGGGLPPGGGGLPPGGGPPPGGGNPGGPGPGGAQQAGRPLATKLWAVPEYKERYRQIYRQLIDRVLLGDKTLARMNQLREMIAPWVEKDTQKLVTQVQFENAMTADATGTGPGGQGGGPGGQGGGIGGQAAGIPGLTPFVTGRLAFVTDKLAAEPPPTMAITADMASIALTQPAAGPAVSATVRLTLNGTSLPGAYSIYASTETGGAWIGLTPAGGAAPGSFTVSNAAKLEAGIYTGEVRVFSPGASNSPLAIPVTLTIQ